MMSISFNLGATDYCDAWLAHTARERKIRLVVLVIAGVVLFLESFRAGDAMTSRAFVISALICIALIPFINWVSRFSFARAFGRGSKGNIAKQLTIDISDKGLHLRDTTSMQEWSYFSRCTEYKTVFVLYRANMIDAILPKRAFNDDSLEAFRQVAQAKLPLKTL